VSVWSVTDVEKFVRKPCGVTPSRILRRGPAYDPDPAEIKAGPNFGPKHPDMCASRTGPNITGVSLKGLRSGTYWNRPAQGSMNVGDFRDRPVRPRRYISARGSSHGSRRPLLLLGGLRDFRRRSRRLSRPFRLPVLPHDYARSLHARTGDQPSLALVSRRFVQDL
jgi:hypothetical protein